MESPVEKFVCMPTQSYNTPSRKVWKIFVGILYVELDRVRARNWNSERVIVFKSVILQRTKVLIIPRRSESAYYFDSIDGIVRRLTSS